MIHRYKGMGVMVVTVLVVLLMAGCTSSPENDNVQVSLKSKNPQLFSVNVNGWNFSVILDDRWQKGSNNPIKIDYPGWSSSFMQGYTSNDKYKGIALDPAFFLTNEGAIIDPANVPDITDSDVDEVLATISLEVVKVPNKFQNWPSQNILQDYSGDDPLATNVKDIRLNNHPARLVESKWTGLDELNMPDMKFASLDVLVTGDTIATIFVQARPKSKLNPTNIVEKFTISTS